MRSWQEYSRTLSGSTPDPPMSSASDRPMIPLRGVRSSCDMVDRKLSLRVMSCGQQWQHSAAARGSKEKRMVPVIDRGDATSDLWLQSLVKESIIWCSRHLQLQHRSNPHTYLVQLLNPLNVFRLLLSPLHLEALGDGEEAGLHERGAEDQLGHPVDRWPREWFTLQHTITS